MIDIIFQAVAVCGLSWLIWRTRQQSYIKTVLEKIPGPSPSSFLTGSLTDLYDPNGWAFHKEIARKYGSVIRVKAFLGATELYVFDPKALHNILVKDQDIYEESPESIAANMLYFGEGLIATLGDQHRKQRKMLNPVFSIAHMRDMVPSFYDITYKLRDAIRSRVQNGPSEIDLFSWTTRTALEVIGQSGLGYSFDPLSDDIVPHPYNVAVKKFIPTIFKMNMSAFLLLPTLSKVGSARFRRFVVDILPWKILHEARDIVDVMYNTSREIYESKKKALSEGDGGLATQIGQGKDIMSILMRANMTASKEESLSESELIGQMSTILFAAMDTTSNALSRTFHLLATHPEVQVRLRQEIVEAKEQHGNEDLPYDTLVSLPYLDAICRETLRLHPPLTQVRRRTREDVILPLSTPIKGRDGQKIGEILVPRNTSIIVGIQAANVNPEIWGPDADEWKPERWLNPLPETVTKAHLPGIYSHLLTFLGGGRACIGFKFSQLEMKVVLSVLIESFKFKPSKEIIWQMNAITNPRAVDSKIPSLPLVIERINA